MGKKKNFSYIFTIGKTDNHLPTPSLPDRHSIYRVPADYRSSDKTTIYSIQQVYCTKNVLFYAIQDTNCIKSSTKCFKFLRAKLYIFVEISKCISEKYVEISKCWRNASTVMRLRMNRSSPCGKVHLQCRAQRGFMVKSPTPRARLAHKLLTK